MHLFEFVVRILTATSRGGRDEHQISIDNITPFTRLILSSSFHRNRKMVEPQNQVEHLGVTVWVEKLRMKRYEIATIEKSGNTTRAGLDIFPFLCGSNKAWDLIFFCKGCPGLTSDQEPPRPTLPLLGIHSGMARRARATLGGDLCQTGGQCEGGSDCRKDDLLSCQRRPEGPTIYKPPEVTVSFKGDSSRCFSSKR